MKSIRIEQVSYQENLLDIKRIRSLVFQQEQGVDPALEFDGYDETCDHLLAYWENLAVGTIRLRYLDQMTVKIERVAVLPQARRQGIGTSLIEKALAIIDEKQTYQTIMIHAQVYLQSLYETLGFKAVGDRFQEAGIWHIKMITHPQPSQKK